MDPDSLDYSEHSTSRMPFKPVRKESGRDSSYFFDSVCLSHEDDADDEEGEWATTRNTMAGRGS